MVVWGLVRSDRHDSRPTNRRNSKTTETCRGEHYSPPKKRCGPSRIPAAKAAQESASARII